LGAVLGLKGPIRAEREISLFNDFLIGFFDQHLVNPDSTLLDTSFQEYDEVVVEQK
jgi:hypothetical protein